MGVIGEKLNASSAAMPNAIKLPETIETKFYSAKIDPVTGALVSLKTKPSGREMLGGPANVIVAEKHHVTGNWNPATLPIRDRSVSGWPPPAISRRIPS